MQQTYLNFSVGLAVQNQVDLTLSLAGSCLNQQEFRVCTCTNKQNMMVG